MDSFISPAIQASPARDSILDYMYSRGIPSPDASLGGHNSSERSFVTGKGKDALWVLIIWQSIYIHL